ncbi:zinc-binding dehydrogenase [Alicyclobacillus ferrooxydans]|uniref:L-erythro-3,5-diaminohexanoate dehydrogenase n=1 Tax=Alicyclobacillus ferrooxydans TaxID=471514 RepID=A0A0P9CBN2_9BACL|nr:zinc-binding dehydrogenase [Alicyclobacillus ferrooxydans]KPV42850.1 L-erythro-3,5-diaminohexanoate dehydrogenase [Alicyclobacillus ferrooxydans]
MTDDPYGLYRVVTPEGSMPQAAWRVDNTPVCRGGEILIDVEMLNIDSASFTQIKSVADNDPARVAEEVKKIVDDRGKMHNPVTGSGGMLIGRVKEIGSRIEARGDVQVGDRVATLVSLSLTPLELRQIHHVDMHNAQLDVEAVAVLFESGIYAKMPEDLPDRIALAMFDVCGAPAQTARLVKPGNTVVLLGAGGKSGLTVLAQARKSAGDGKIVAIEYGDAGCERIRKLGFADVVLNLDATKSADVYQAVTDALGGELADVVINCVNVPGTEMSSILCAKDRGTVYFFSMATSFTAAALGAEGVGKDVDLMIGNGYCKDHADHALNLLRDTPALLEVFEQKFAAGAK